MTSRGMPVPVAPEGLRPGQLGVVMLGRVVMADIATTLVDLCLRDLLYVEKVTGADGDDWSLRPRPAQAGRVGAALLGYEETLLKGLARQGEDCHLSWLPSQAAHLLDATRSAIVHESVHRGWLRHLDHKQTAEGEELTRKARAFQRQVRHFISEASGQAVPDELLAYALRLGLMTSDDAPLVQFAHAWVVAFADLPGWQAPKPKPQPQPRSHEPDYGPLLTNDDRMSAQIAAAFLLI